ncbi:MAG: glycosyl hydrolase family 18 protein [Bacteroidales bacterium]|nr:glycosyl hydrolase family 18 protein [Bacteroidales bacterium]
MPVSCNKYTAKALIPVFLSLITWNLYSQETDTLKKGIHQVESEFYSTIFPKDQPYDGKGMQVPSKLITTGSKTLTRKVLGWHPYWASSSAYLSYDYDALSHIAYFSYEVDTATGGYTTLRGWNTTPIIDYAHQKGTKVLLTVTNFGSSKNTEILTDTVKQKYMIQTLISLLKSRNGDGVNFDLESVSFSQRVNLVNFIALAVSMIKSEMPSAEISMATPAVDWNNSFNLAALSDLCDYLIVMGYNYYWSSSTTAGPVAPLGGETYNIMNTINTYLNSGVVPGKLYLGVPWYGLDWPVVSEVRKSTATGTASARTYSAAQQLADDHSKNFDQTTKVPWTRYTSSSEWRQMWFEDTQSLSLKYNLVNFMNLGGTGIWALSYEGAYKDVWETIISAFSVPVPERNMIIRIYPNPVKGISKIEFTVANKVNITIRIYDLLGRERMTIVDEQLEPGFYSEEFNSEYFGQGIYLCVLQVANSTSTCKIVVVK